MQLFTEKDKSSYSYLKDENKMICSSRKTFFLVNPNKISFTQYTETFARQA